MKFIIFLVVCLMNINASFADEALKEYSFREWDVIEKNVYTDPSFIYLSQNPFPTCYALTANTLIDLYECKKDSKTCTQRSSYLETALMGEVKDPKQTRSLSNGGNTLLILNEVRKAKTITSYNSCNYNHITHNINVVGTMNSSIEVLKKDIDNYFKYSSTSPYLAQYYKKVFFRQILNDYTVKSKDAQTLLVKDITTDKLYEYVLRYNCQSKESYPIQPYKINTFIDKGKDSTNKKMDELLAQKIPFAVTFCLNQKTTTLKQEMECVDRHIIVVNGTAKVKNFGTGEEKNLLNVINTWGQDWQTKTNSLIDYDNFKEYIFQNLIWITDTDAVVPVIPSMSEKMVPTKMDKKGIVKKNKK